MKKSFLAMLASVLIFITISCSPRHYYSTGFIRNPSFNMYGANLKKQNNDYSIKSYIRSEIAIRTEYIYENFNISFPKTFQQDKKYNINEKGVTIWYAKGGQAGQIETTKARGHFTIKDISDDSVKLNVDLTFYGFTRTKTSGLITLPKSIKRQGCLSAKEGYKLYHY